MTRLPLIALLATATPAFAEPNDFVPDSGFLIIGTDHVGGPKQYHGGWTDYAKPIMKDRWDEGLGVRGGGLTFETTAGDISVSAYKNSFPDGGMGYSLSYSTPALVEYRGVSAHGVAQLNWYPDEPTLDLQETNGLFPSFGVSMRYEHESGAGLFVNVYPDIGDRKTFDYLYAAGVSYSWR